MKALSTPTAKIVKTSSSKVWDTIESKLSVSVYHANKWIQKDTICQATFHSMKFMDEKDFYFEAPFEHELSRIPRIIESKLTGDFRTNPISSINVYLNLNKGRTIRDANNFCVLKIGIKGNKITLVEINQEDQYWIDKLEEVVSQIQQKYYETSLNNY